MTLPLWGQMQKSMDDSTTIEQAIAQSITEHEEDPEAHLGEGESLQQHKSESVIDHPIGSIVPDKSSARDLFWTYNFLTVDGFTSVGDTDAGDSGLDLYVENGYVDVSSISRIPASETLLDNLKCSVLLDVALHFENGDSATAEASFNGLTFEIEDDQVRLVVDMAGMSSPETSSWYAVDMTKIHFLRAVYFAHEDIVRFYVDGDLGGEIEAEYTPSSNDIDFKIELTRNSSSDNYLYVLQSSLSLYEFQD